MDNVNTNDSAGAVVPVAADDIGGVKFQRVKFTLGADGVNDGDVNSANPMPVVLSAADAAAIGATNEAPAASDTATSGLNGLLKRIAQNITSLIGRLPASIGIKASAGSLSVVLASDQAIVPVSLQGASGALAVTGTFYQATQPVSGTVGISGTVPVSGSFWQATQPVSLAINTPDVTDRSGRLLGHVTVDNASIPVTGTFYQATQPISAASLPLPAGAATEATLAAQSAKLPASIGAKASAASLSVVLASDQVAVPISAAALPLPTGAATETTLAAVNTKLPASLGAKTGAGSLSIVPGTDANLLSDGTTGGSVVNGGTGQNFQLVGGGYKEVSFSLAATNLSAIDCSNYAEVSVHITAIAGGTLTFQTSNDTTNWVSQTLVTSNASASAPTNATASAGMWSGKVSGRYFRLSDSAGTCSGIIELSSIAKGVAGMAVAQGANPWAIVSTPNGGTGGVSLFHKAISAATTNATSVKASAAAINHLRVDNLTAGVKYFKLYNKASAPTVGTDTPIHTYAIQPNSFIDIQYSGSHERLNIGLAYAITGGLADSDTTAIAANDCVVNIGYA